MKKKLFNIFGTVFIIVGICVMLYPKFTEWQAQQENKEMVDEFKSIVNPNCNDPDLVYVPGSENQNADAAEEAYGEMDLENDESADKDKKREDLLKKQTIYGMVEIPTLDLSYAVVKGTNKDCLHVAIGHMNGTAHFGQQGNCVIAGHRGGLYGEFFKNINKLKSGDTVNVTNIRGEIYTYKVYKQFVVSPSDMYVTENIGDESTLTLITCENNGKKRLIVRCQLVK